MSLLDSKGMVIVTCFSKHQPGFLDFSYRIKSLSANYNVTVLGNLPHSPEFGVLEDRYQRICAGDGVLGWFNYLIKCIYYIWLTNPDSVVLMHSIVSPIAIAIKKPVAIYWNEHPSHFSPDGEGWVKNVFRSLIRTLLYKGARSADVVMPIGEAHRDDLCSHGCDLRKISMFYMGVDVAFKCAERKVDYLEKIRIVYVGTVSPARGRDVMLGALKILTLEGYDVSLLLVGADSDEKSYCENFARDHDLLDRLFVKGRVPGSLIPKLISEADFGLCLWENKPWWNFNPPTKLFEYLVAGLPVFASDIRTHTRYIKDGFNGCIFDYSANGLAAAVKRVFVGEVSYRRLLRGVKKTSSQYIWQDIENDFLATISKIQE